MLEISSNPVPTVTYIPKPVRAAWAREWNKVASDAVFFNDDLHVTLLAMFAQATLAAPKRGGKRNISPAEFIASNLSLWRNEQYEEVLESSRMEK